jgi:hypothetical protein
MYDTIRQMKRTPATTAQSFRSDSREFPKWVAIASCCDELYAFCPSSQKFIRAVRQCTLKISELNLTEWISDESGSSESIDEKIISSPLSHARDTRIHATYVWVK